MNDKRSVLFDVSKNELFRISDNYKTLARKLKGNFTVLKYAFIFCIICTRTYYGISISMPHFSCNNLFFYLSVIDSNKEEVTSKVLTDISVFVLAGPRAPFTDDEFNHIREYIERGGSLLVALGEGGEKFFHTNVNFLLEEYGMMINNGMASSQLQIFASIIYVLCTY